MTDIRRHTQRWGDTKDVSLVPPSPLPGPTPLAGETNELARIKVRQPVVWLVRFAVTFPGGVWEQEAVAPTPALVDIVWRVAHGSGSANTTVFVATQVGGPYPPYSTADFYPAEFITIDAMVSTTVTVPGEHVVKVSAYAAPWGVILQEKDVLQE